MEIINYKGYEILKYNSSTFKTILKNNNTPLTCTNLYFIKVLINKDIKNINQ